MRYEIISTKFDNLAKYSATALGFSIPISTAVDSILLLLIVMFWLLGAKYRNKITIIKGNPIAMLALLVFGMYVLGLFYGDADRKAAMESLANAANFLLIPLLIPLFRENEVQHRALWAFLSAMLLTLLFSYLLWLDLLPHISIFKGSSASPVVFKSKITQNIFMAFSAFLFATKARYTTGRWAQLLFATLGILAMHNVLFLVLGKTGHVVILLLTAYFFINWLRWKGAIAAAAFMGLLAIILYFVPSSAFHQRFSSAIHQFSEWKPDQPNETSVGQRLEYYRNSLQIIHENPLFGVGTGGFAKSYAKQINGSNMDATDNPHNDYLMTAVQLGLIGLAVLLYLFFTQWRLAKKLTDEFKQAGARALVLTFLSASMVSSTLIDHSEGLLYVWLSALLFAGLDTSRDIKRRER